MLCLQIGKSALNLHTLFPDFSTYTIITAHNPRSQIMSAADNRLANQRLLNELQSLPQIAVCAPTVAEDPQNAWPDEPGFLAANLTYQQAIAMGKAFSQYAVVWFHEPRFRAELLMCDEG